MRQIILTVIWISALISFDVYTVQAQNFLNNEDIAETLIGNTMQIADYQTGEPVMVFTMPGGRFKSHFKGRYSDGKWWIQEDGIFCRQYVGQSRTRCSRMTVEGDTLTFHDSRSDRSFEAKLMVGNKLP